jgi:hypothetical protein
LMLGNIGSQAPAHREADGLGQYQGSQSGPAYIGQAEVICPRS